MKQPDGPTVAGASGRHIVDPVLGNVFEKKQGSLKYIPRNPRGLYADTVKILQSPHKDVKDFIADGLPPLVRSILHLTNGYPDAEGHRKFWIASSIVNAAIEGEPLERLWVCVTKTKLFGCLVIVCYEANYQEVAEKSDTSNGPLVFWNITGVLELKNSAWPGCAVMRFVPHTKEEAQS